MDQILRCDWLPERARRGYLVYRHVPQDQFPRKPYNKSFIDQACSVKMAGCSLRSIFAGLWTSTLSQSINKQKKNLTNIQPSWPRTWSITLAQEHNKMSPARAWTQTTRSGVEFTNHEATAPPMTSITCCLYNQFVLSGGLWAIFNPPSEKIWRCTFYHNTMRTLHGP